MAIIPTIYTLRDRWYNIVWFSDGVGLRQSPNLLQCSCIYAPEGRITSYVHEHMIYDLLCINGSYPDTFICTYIIRGIDTSISTYLIISQQWMSDCVYKIVYARQLICVRMKMLYVTFPSQFKDGTLIGMMASWPFSGLGSIGHILIYSEF